MIKPTIHLNGTSAGDLYEQYSAQISLLRSAVSAMANNGPNGRDYYPQGNGAIFEAMEEHNKRIGRVQRVIEELEELQAHVAERVK